MRVRGEPLPRLRRDGDSALTSFSASSRAVGSAAKPKLSHGLPRPLIATLSLSAARIDGRTKALIHGTSLLQSIKPRISADDNG